MNKHKIAVTQIGTDASVKNLICQISEDPALLELCTPVVCNNAEARKDVDATVLVSTGEPIVSPADATEIIVTGQTHLMTLTKEPTAEDIVKFRDILERDLDLRSPRIAIVQENNIQNTDLASQVTTEQSINTYGPYTVEQILAEDNVLHFDGIVTADKALANRILTELPEEAPVQFFAGRETVVTAACQPTDKKEEEDGLADVSWLTHPFYIAIDVIRNRAFYDEARQNPLPKLFHDKREDKRKDNAPQTNNNKEEKEQA